MGAVTAVVPWAYAGYDSPVVPCVRRGLGWDGVLVGAEAVSRRVACPGHGVVAAAAPWAYAGGRFAREYDLTVAWLAGSVAGSVVAEPVRVGWAAVGGRVSRTLGPGVL